MGSLCTGSYRGVPPLGSADQGVRPACGGPQILPPFSMMLNDCHMVQKWVMAPNALRHVNHPSSCMHYTPNFCGCHFLPKLPLGHLSNSKIHGGLWCKRWENKICKGFHAKDAMFMKESKWNWGKFKHAMVEIKYGITTDLPVGKGSKFRVFWTRHFIPSNLISSTK